MFHREKVIATLEAKADRFNEYEKRAIDLIRVYEEAFTDLEKLSLYDLTERLAGVPWPGARPTIEQDQQPNIIVPFEEDWSTHEQARDWARDVLEDIPTIAVDGSQITPNKDLSIPVGAVQIGWFINPHSIDQPYIKDIDFDVLPPDELADPDEDVFGFPDWRVNIRRFLWESYKLIDLMESYRNAETAPICFFDGSLIISFVEHMRPARQRKYVQAVMNLLEASERCRVPLVGYVDTSYAKDLIDMLGVLIGAQPERRISDGAILRRRMGWGDRTIAYVCARDDNVDPVGGGKYYSDLLFVYLKTTADRPPSRLDLPRWVLEEGQLEHVLNVVRAECVVGNGYPYAVETADAVAVITHQDRERFYRLFQEFAEKEGLPLRFSRKSVSKRGRRE
jgi:hypothetical protein